MLALAVVFGTGVVDFAPVKGALVERHNDDLCGSNIGGNGNVAHVAHAKQVNVALVDRVGRRIGAAEVEQNVDFVKRDAGSDLLRAA